jgi:hypothetical protein
MTEPDAVANAFPIACTLPPTQLRERRAGLLETLLKAAEYVDSLSSGTHLAA